LDAGHGSGPVKEAPVYRDVGKCHDREELQVGKAEHSISPPFLIPVGDAISLERRLFIIIFYDMPD
jgi:hypothetical protein